jgi:hypothetical protein
MVMCSVVPAPGVAYVTVPGFAFACATNSCHVFHGLSAFTTTPNVYPVT